VQQPEDIVEVKRVVQGRAGIVAKLEKPAAIDCLDAILAETDVGMPVRLAVDALAQLQGLGAVATLDRFPGLGHGIDMRVVDAIVRRLEDAVPGSI
jgi:hypothetical protein